MYIYNKSFVYAAKRNLLKVTKPAAIERKFLSHVNNNKNNFYVLCVRELEKKIEEIEKKLTFFYCVMRFCMRVFVFVSRHKNMKFFIL